MRRLDIIRRAGRSLRQAKVRTLLTALAIGVGAFTVTISLAAGAGSRSYANQLIGSNIDPQSLFIAKDKNLFGGGGVSAGGLNDYNPDSTTRNGASFAELTQSDVKKLQSISSIKNVQPVYQVSALYVTFQGSDTKYTTSISTYGDGIISQTAAGSLPTRGTQIGDNDIVMPSSYLTKLGVSDPHAMIGKTVTVTLKRAAPNVTESQIEQAFLTGGAAAAQVLTQPQLKDYVFNVSAVTEQSSTTLNATNALQISANQSQVMYNYLSEGTSSFQKYIAVTAVAKDGVKPVDAKATVEKAGYVAQTAQDLESLIFTIVNILQDIVIGFGIIALIASVFGIINTQYISVLERTQQIGLMKALGMSGKDVAKLFRYEAAWIGFLGGVIGSAAAIVLGLALNPWITKTLGLGDGNNLLIFQPVPIAAMIIILILIAIVAGYFPARKAAKLDPIEALRTE